ncbi:MAG: cupin domain-containing protein [Geobacteraceae bacterium]|nr:cupin domain-containing protein [Geobacteraceae bacterium]
MPPEISNILASLHPALTDEVFETIVGAGDVRIERIISNGQSTPEGEWYDQSQDEWVLLLSGSAGLLFEDSTDPVRLAPGEHLLIPAGCRHRVAWTDPQIPTVWLAVHYTAEPRP